MSRLGKLKRKNAPYTNSPLRVSHAVYSVTGSGGNGSDVAGSGHVTPGDVMEQGRVSKSSSGSRRILRNIPTIKGGVWNALTMRMPKIKFVKRFESVDTLRG